MNSLANHHLSPWFRLSILISFLCMGAVLGQLLILLFFPNAIRILQDFNLHIPDYKSHLLTIQTILASSIFIVAPLFYWLFIEKKPIQYFFQGKQPYFKYALLALGLTFSFIVVNTLFIYLNLHLKLPEFLKDFEAWAQAKEAALKELTKLLTTFSSPKDLFISIVVIAVIPAIGEELLFRGLLQKLFHQLTHNIHWAIILSALIFSAIHMQFYGFIPRFTLGLLFGYIYWWTNNLALAILAHFFNNAFTLVVLYLQQYHWISYDPTTDQLPPIWVLLLFSLLSIIFAVALQKMRQTHYHKYS